MQNCNFIMDLELQLERIGLGKQEAKVYLSAIKLGLAKASQIAQKANVKREAAYYTLSLLHERGFISEVIKSGVKYYSAVQPKRIIELIEEEKQQKTAVVNEIIPELEALHKVAITRPKIEIYEGTEGLKTAASIMTREKNQTIYCYVPEKILHFTPYFHPQFRMRRKENKVFLKVISQRTPAIEQMKKLDSQELRETRFNDNIIGEVDSAYYILPKGIIILKANEKEQLGIYIEEPSTAKIQKRVFEEIWKTSKTR